MDEAEYDDVIAELSRAGEPLRELDDRLKSAIDDADRSAVMSPEDFADIVAEAVRDTERRVNEVPVIRPGSGGREDIIRVERWQAIAAQRLTATNKIATVLRSVGDADAVDRTLRAVRGLREIFDEVPVIRPPTGGVADVPPIRPGDDD